MHEGLLSERSRPQWTQGVFSLCRDPVSSSTLGDSNLKSLLESRRIWKTVICVFVSQLFASLYLRVNFIKITTIQGALLGLGRVKLTESELWKWLLPKLFFLLLCMSVQCCCYFFKSTHKSLQWSSPSPLPPPLLPPLWVRGSAHPWLSWNSVSRTRWFPTYRDPPASASECFKWLS